MKKLIITTLLWPWRPSQPRQRAVLDFQTGTATLRHPRKTEELREARHRYRHL